MHAVDRNHSVEVSSAMLIAIAWYSCCSSALAIEKLGDTSKPGPWTLDWTMDWTVD